MLISKFRNKYLKEKTEESKSLYNKQRNICVSLLCKTKRKRYVQLDNKIVIDNRKFWKAVSPLFSENAFYRESVILKEHGKTITDNEKIAEKFNNFFSNIVKNLNIDGELRYYKPHKNIVKNLNIDSELRYYKPDKQCRPCLQSYQEIC